MPRILKLLVLILFSAFVLLQGSGIPDAGASADQVHEFILDNGMRVITLPRGDDPPTVSLEVWIAAGAAEEPDEKAGLAHFFEHMVFGGTDTLAIGEFTQRIEAVGGTLNATTGHDYTSYDVSIPSAHVEEAIALLGEVTTRPAFPEAMFEREREVIYRELEFRGDSPYRTGLMGLYRLLFSPHPYAREVGGTRETVAAITREDMFRFVKEQYVPERMTLVVVGDIDPERVFQAARDAFGHVPPRPAPERASPPLPPLGEEPPTLRIVRDLEQTQLFLGWRAPSIRDEDSHALRMVEAMLSRGRSARLEQKIRKERGLVRSVSAGYAALREHGLFLVHAELPPQNELAVESALWEEIERIRRGEFTARELERARTLVLADYVFGLESHGAMRSALGRAQAVAGDWRYVFEAQEALRNVTAEDVTRAARRYLSREAYARVTVGPEEEAPVRAAARLDPESTEPQRFVLDNGHVFIVQNRPHSPVVAVETVALAGRLQEPAGKAGVSALTLRMLLKGTAALTEEEFYTRVEELGGRIGGSSGADVASLELLSIPESFDALLALYADVLQQLSFTPEDLEKEREQLRRELLASRDDFFNVALEGFLEALYGDHPYGAGSRARLEALDRLTAEDVEAFYETFYAPNNLVTAVVGPVDPVKVQETLTRAFGSRSARPLPEGERPPVPTPREPVDVALEGATDAGWLIVGFPAPSTSLEERPVLRVLQGILGEGFSSLLFQELRERHALTYTTGAVAPMRKDPGFFAAYAITPPRKEAIDAATEGILRVFTEHIADVDDTLISRAREMAVGRFVMARETASAQASLLAEFEALGLGYEAVKGYPELLQEVNREALLAMAEKLFRRERAIRAFVLPAGD